MKNIHLIPTDKPSKIALSFEKLFFNSKPLSPILYKNQNICITNDEEIKDGDWCYYENGDLKGIHKVINGKIPKTMFLKKIILTTDQDLIKDGVQAISDEFIELFIKNLNCERVEVVDDTYTVGEMSKLPLGTRNHKYKIIIPKEELKQETLEEAAEKQWGKLAIINDSAAVIAFKAGAKWQAERMYSEEEVYDILVEHTIELFKKESKTLNEWFEQFKKK